MSDKEKQPPKPRRRRTQFQDIPPETRRTVTEYLQPPTQEQGMLRHRYLTMRNDEEFAKQWAELDDDPMTRNVAERQARTSRSRYHQLLEKLTKTPGIWETYRYFWDSSKPFPDQRPGGGGYGPDTPLTS